MRESTEVNHLIRHAECIAKNAFVDRTVNGFISFEGEGSRAVIYATCHVYAAERAPGCTAE
ncbi:hypothetical protein CA603_16920 [Paraburkholderia hospita]|jgi:hypothetical protein|nr:hypothetical protein CA603_16920 [Paraburkholderia hospita]